MNENYFLSLIIFFLVLIFGFGIYFDLRSKFLKRKSLSGFVKIVGISLALGFGVYYVGKWHFGILAEEKAKAKFYGAPISCRVQNFEGKVFHPQAFVVTEEHILVYDKDDKVYALDGIELDGITPEQLTVASNINYTVYQKQGYLLFGKL